MDDLELDTCQLCQFCHKEPVYYFNLYHISNYCKNCLFNSKVLKKTLSATKDYPEKISMKKDRKPNN